MTKISVLMPVYRTIPQYLKEAIQSVLEQNYTDFEFLILDDCPQDTRKSIIRSFKDKRIKYIKNNENMGITPSRNKLVKMAKGKYLAIMDHDDIALPNRFEEQVKILDTNKKIGVVGCWVERFPKTKVAKYPEHNKEIEEYLMQGCAIAHTGAMVRKSLLDKIQYEKDFSPSEDYRLWCQLIGKTKFYNVPKILIKYRWYEGNTSKKQANKMTEATKKIRSFVREQHKEIWKNVCNTAPHVIRIKLFGVIPLKKIHQKGNSYNGFLRYIPFVSIKSKLEVK